MPMADLADLERRVAAMAGSAKTKRQDNRRAMPETAAWLDDITRLFGKPPAGRVTEAGRTVKWGDQALFDRPSVVPVVRRPLQARVRPARR